MPQIAAFQLISANFQRFQPFFQMEIPKSSSKRYTNYMGDISDLLPWDQDKNDYNGGRHVSTPTAIVYTVAGMLGTSLLVVPLMGITAGSWTTVWVSLLVGYLLYYTAYLIITHLGVGRGMKDCILSHFGNDYFYMRGYSFIIWLSFIPYLFLRFKVTCLELQSLIGYHSPWTAPIMALFLIVLTILVRVSHFAEQTMALGIVSYILFVIFLSWAFVTAPAGPQTVPSSGPPFFLAAALISSLEIHDFLAQNILKNPNKKAYNSIVKWSFFIGTLVYLFATEGSFAIINRPIYTSPPQVISDYFSQSQWQITIIELSFIIVPFTSFPNYLLVSKIRFFQMFNVDLKAKVTLKQIMYIAGVVILCLVIFETGVNFQQMYALNGSVIAFVYVIIIPIWIHFKCVWYDRSSGFIQNDPEWNAQITPNNCECDNRYRSKLTLYLETAFLVFVILLGFALMIFTLTATQPPTPTSSTTKH